MKSVIRLILVTLLVLTFGGCEKQPTKPPTKEARNRNPYLTGVSHNVRVYSLAGKELHTYHKVINIYNIPCQYKVCIPGIMLELSKEPIVKVAVYNVTVIAEQQ